MWGGGITKTQKIIICHNHWGCVSKDLKSYKWTIHCVLHFCLKLNLKCTLIRRLVWGHYDIRLTISRITEESGRFEQRLVICFEYKEYFSEDKPTYWAPLIETTNFNWTFVIFMLYLFLMKISKGFITLWGETKRGNMIILWWCVH